MTEPHSVRALLVRAGTRQLALRLDEVCEVMRTLPTEPVAGQPAHVLGLAVVRGRPRVVLDLGLLTTGQATKGAYYVLARSGERSYVLSVDAIDGVTTLSGGSLTQLAELRQGDTPPPFAAISLRGRAPVFLLDTAGLARRLPADTASEAA